MYNHKKQQQNVCVFSQSEPKPQWNAVAMTTTATTTTR